MHVPRISIITPSFNQGHFIEETITSVLDQKYPNLEYIIIDGGSTDNTIEVIKKYEKHITYWISESDKGQSDAINKGLRIASGDVINWLNSDDYYMAGCLDHVASIFSNKNVTAYCGKSRVFSEKQEYISQGTDIYSGNVEKTIGWARIDQPETFFRKEVWEKLIKVNQAYHFVMDKELWVRYLSLFGVTGIYKDEQVLVNFRLHGESKTVSLKQRFEQETHNLFYSYATSLGLNEYCKILESLAPVQTLPFESMPENLSQVNWTKVFNYYLLYKFLEAYAQTDYAQASKVKPYINSSILTQEDRRHFEKVSVRMRIMPAGVKRFINNL